MTKQVHYAVSTGKAVTLDRITKDFSWLGIVLTHHKIGPYVIVEYRRMPEREISYGLYINGHQTSHSFGSMDAAIAAGIAFRQDGPNCQAAFYFVKSLGLQP